MVGGNWYEIWLRSGMGSVNGPQHEGVQIRPPLN